MSSKYYNTPDTELFDIYQEYEAIGITGRDMQGELDCRKRNRWTKQELTYLSP